MLTWLQTLRGSPLHTLGSPGLLLCRREKGEPAHSAPSPGLAPATARHTPVSQTVMLGWRSEESVTLFSSAAAICWSLNASCIFWAAGSSSRALIILVGEGVQVMSDHSPGEGA